MRRSCARQASRAAFALFRIVSRTKCGPDGHDCFRSHPPMDLWVAAATSSLPPTTHTAANAADSQADPTASRCSCDVGCRCRESDCGSVSDLHELCSQTNHIAVGRRVFVGHPLGGRLGIGQGGTERSNQQVAMVLGEDQRWPDLEDVGIRSCDPNENPATT